MSNEIIERLVRMETKLDSALDRQRDHESRIRCVEKKSWYACGAIAVLVAAWEVIKFNLRGHH